MKKTIVQLLDLATSGTGETARTGAVRRVAALARDDRELALSAALPGLVAVSLSEADPRLARGAAPRLSTEVRAALAPAVEPSHPDRTRRAAKALARLAASVASFGAPLPDPRIDGGEAIPLGRSLLRLDRAGCARVVATLGLTDVAFLCRDLDSGSAGRLLRRLDGERAALPEVVDYVPAPDPGALKRSCQRLAASAAGATRSHSLVRSLGLRIVAGLMSAVEGDVAAALARRIGCDPDAAAFDSKWITPAVAIAEREVAR